MSFQIDMRVLELLASRLCHDIVGPVGAVSNGMEMLEDDEFGMADEAMKLASVSARLAELAEEHGMPIPETFRPKTLEAAKALSRSLRYPVLLKPRKGVSGHGIQGCRDHRFHLLKVLKHLLALLLIWHGIRPQPETGYRRPKIVGNRRQHLGSILDEGPEPLRAR